MKKIAIFLMMIMPIMASAQFGFGGGGGVDNKARAALDSCIKSDDVVTDNSAAFESLYYNSNVSLEQNTAIKTLLKTINPDYNFKGFAGTTTEIPEAENEADELPTNFPVSVFDGSVGTYLTIPEFSFTVGSFIEVLIDLSDVKPSTSNYIVGSSTISQGISYDGAYFWMKNGTPTNGGDYSSKGRPELIRFTRTSETTYSITGEDGDIGSFSDVSSSTLVLDQIGSRLNGDASFSGSISYFNFNNELIIPIPSLLYAFNRVDDDTYTVSTITNGGGVTTDTDPYGSRYLYEYGYIINNEVIIPKSPSFDLAAPLVSGDVEHYGILDPSVNGSIVNDCYITEESGTIFGIENVEKNKLLVFSGSEFEEKDIEIEATNLFKKDEYGGAIIESDINEGWDGWSESRLIYGLSPGINPIPVKTKGQTMSEGTVIIGGEETYKLRWGYHILEGYFDNEISRVTLIVNKHTFDNSKVSELYTYLTPGEEAVNYGWVRIGSDLDDHSFIFSANEMIGFGSIDLRNVITLARIAPSTDIDTTYSTVADADAAHNPETDSDDNNKCILYLALKNAENGTMFYDTERDKIVVKKAGVWHDIETTEVPTGTYSF